MVRRLLPLLLAFALVVPQGWTSVALYLCGGEAAIHIGDKGDCCTKHDCAHHADEEQASGACCSELADSDDRATTSPDAPLPDLIDAGPPPEPTWPKARVGSDRIVGSWMLGPPPLGPPPWLRFRTLLI